MQSNKVVSPYRGRSAFTLIELLVVIVIILLLAAILFPVFARARENARRSACQSNLKQAALAIHQYAQDWDERLPSYMAATTPVWDKVIEPYLGINVANVNKAMILACPSDSTPRMYSSCTPQYNAQVRTYTMPAGANISTLISGAYTKPCPTCYTTAYYPGRNLAEVGGPAETILLTEKPSSGNIFANNIGASVKNPTEQTTQSCSMPSVQPIHFEGWNYLFADGHVKWMQPIKTVNGPGKTGGTLDSPRGMWTIATND